MPYTALGHRKPKLAVPPDKNKPNVSVVNQPNAPTPVVKRRQEEMLSPRSAAATAPAEKRPSAGESVLSKAREGLRKTLSMQNLSEGEPSTNPDLENPNDADPITLTPSESKMVVFVVSNDSGEEEIDLNKVSCIKIARELKRLVGTYCEGKVVGKDTIKFQAKAAYCDHIRKISKFLEYKVTITIGQEAGPRDFVWGKIFSHSLINADDDEIQEQLQQENQGVMFAKRICKGAYREPTKLIRIKFQGTELPEEVYCCNSTPYVVTPYFPPVKRCWNCNLYGHWTSECRNEWKCKCGRRHERSAPCQAPAFCLHCRENHHPNDPKCRKLNLEREVIAISHEKNISFKEARSRAVDGELSYATVAKKAKNPINVNSTSVPIKTHVEVANAETGRDSWDAVMEEDIEACKDIINIKETDKVIHASTVIDDTNTTEATNEWSDMVQRITHALNRDVVIPENNKDKVTRALKLILAHVEQLANSDDEID